MVRMNPLEVVVVGDAESTAWISTGKLPQNGVVPEKIPVVGPRTMPFGSTPLLMLQENGVMPPVVIMGAL